MSIYPDDALKAAKLPTYCRPATTRSRGTGQKKPGDSGLGKLVITVGRWWLTTGREGTAGLSVKSKEMVHPPRRAVGRQRILKWAGSRKMEGSKKNPALRSTAAD
jgi:hypothetical protein